MLKATCKHCNRYITYKQGDNGLWFDFAEMPETQYCYIDEVKGSRLHEPNPDTIVDDTK